jgi:hypothetical protein
VSLSTRHESSCNFLCYKITYDVTIKLMIKYGESKTLCTIKHHAIKLYRGVEIPWHKMQVWASFAAGQPPNPLSVPSTRCIRGWRGPSANLAPVKENLLAFPVRVWLSTVHVVTQRVFWPGRPKQGHQTKTFPVITVCSILSYSFTNRSINNRLRQYTFIKIQNQLQLYA